MRYNLGTGPWRRGERGIITWEQAPGDEERGGLY